MTSTTSLLHRVKKLNYGQGVNVGLKSLVEWMVEDKTSRESKGMVPPPSRKRPVLPIDQSEAVQKIEKGFESTESYIETVHGEHIQPYFKPIIQAVDSGKFPRIVVSACHAVGKSFTFSRIVEALMSQYNEIITICTAPTHRQIKDIIFSELAVTFRKKEKHFRRGTMNQVEWNISPKTYCKGFSVRKTVSAESGQGTQSDLQGYHSDFMIVLVFDEATGIEAAVWKMAEGLMTSGFRVLFLAIGNPTSRNCEFYKCFNNMSWKKFTISCFDSPNLKANNINNTDDVQKEADYIATLPDEEKLERLASYEMPVPYLINTRYVLEKCLEWGISHPLFLSKVLGRFPDLDDNLFMTYEDVKGSMDRPDNKLEELTNVHGYHVGYAGLDVARFGPDSSLFTGMIGHQQICRVKMDHMNTNQVCGIVINKFEELQDKHEYIERWRLCIDAGYNPGVIDRLKELQTEEENERVFRILSNVEILEINFGSTDWIMYHYGNLTKENRKTLETSEKVKSERENYCNYKAKMFDLLSRDIREEIKILPDPIYTEQLPKIQRDLDSRGRLKVESKDDYKERTGETSPDDSDSLALCNFGRHFSVVDLSIVDIFKR